MCINNLAKIMTLLYTLSNIKRSFPWHSTSIKSPTYKRGTKVTYYSSLRRSTIKMMPEGPEVRSVVNKLQPAVGMRLLNIKFISGRYMNQKPVGFDEFRFTMSQQTPPHYHSPNANDHGTYDKTDLIREWKCKGKFIYIILDNGLVKDELINDYMRSMWITLGMSGRFYSEKEVDKTSSTLRWYLELYDYKSSKIRRIYYVDSRNFGTLKFSLSRLELGQKIDSLGPDMLNDDMTEDIFLNRLASSRSDGNICKVLMNQKIISGIGNYLLSEGLYKSNIDPFASLNELDTNQRKLLYHTLRNTSMKSFLSQIRNDDEFELECYGRKISSCGKEVIREIDGPHGRAIWYVEDQLFVPREERRLGFSEDKVILDDNNDDGNDDNSSIDPIDLKSYINNGSWKNALENFTSSEKFESITKYLNDERTRGYTIYPPSNNIFSALNLCPLENVKVVIVGQDPYHGPNQAHGLAFSVQKGVPIPPSLKNIFLEMVNDIGIETTMPTTNGNLEYLAKQGVLLLNTVLTVRRSKANSHAKIGWEDFTNEVLNILNSEKEGLVFLCWGNAAIKKVSDIIDQNKHFVITTSHPSPLGATKTSSPFIGSRCFSRCNEYLEEDGVEPIFWLGK